MHYDHGESTTIVIASDIEALGHYGLTMALLVDRDPHELTITLMNLPWSLSDRDIILEGCYHFIVAMLLTMVVVNVPQS